VRALLLGTALAVWGAEVLGAANVPKTSEPPRLLGSPDTRLTLAARTALASDPRLASCGFGVSARNGEVILWGKSPSAELIEEAKRRLARVPGVKRVRSQAWVVWPEDVIDGWPPRQPKPEPPPA
jgi:hypothetical protein